MNRRYFDRQLFISLGRHTEKFKFIFRSLAATERIRISKIELRGIYSVTIVFRAFTQCLYIDSCKHRAVAQTRALSVWKKCKAARSGREGGANHFVLAFTLQLHGRCKRFTSVGRMRNPTIPQRIRRPRDGPGLCMPLRGMTPLFRISIHVGGAHEEI
jgi:hypothetical protein